MQSGAIDTLVMLGVNPVYDAPADVPFADAIANVKHAIQLSRYEDETSPYCEWHLPETHAFESWGDATAYDGTISLGQPLILPLLNGKSALELLAMVCCDAVSDGQEIVRRALAERLGRTLSEAEWRRGLHDGLLPETQLPQINPDVVAERPAIAQAGGDLEVVFTAGTATYDGRFANNGWLQETPGPLTKLTWDNAALVSPKTASKLGIEHATLIELRHGEQSLTVPAFVLPGQAEGSIGIALGYGRTAAGHVGGSDKDGVDPVGVNANPFRTSKAMDIATDVTVTPTKTKFALATTQEHHAVDVLGFQEIGHRVGELVREGTLDEYKEHPDFATHHAHGSGESLWTEPSYDGHAWGMSIDLNKCLACNACVVACQSENNVPIVGKEQVLQGREMHWVRVDRYFSGDVDDPEVTTQPVACQHCENAPCEQVCPVAATVHSDEGLNSMIYNRCVGTRYCANNCPYKVRRFNFFDNEKQLKEEGRELVQLQVNPQVTVRSRGVMEKCTYCVQRIQQVKIDAKNEGRPIQDGEIKNGLPRSLRDQRDRIWGSKQEGQSGR